MGRRVVVIGGGAAGAWSALAARQSGAEVCLVRQASGASALSSGCFDFAAEPDLEGKPLAPIAAARALARRRPMHPFALLGDGLASTIRETTQFLIDQHTSLGVRASDRNLHLATPLGAIKETALAQGPIAGGDLTTDARVGVVAVPNRTAFDASAVAAGLTALGVDAIALPCLYEGTVHSSLAQLAAWLDDAAVRQAFVSKVMAAMREAGAKLVLLPTAGLSDPLSTVAAFAPLRAAEVMGAPPSVPGLRLDMDLERRLAENGVERITASGRSGSPDRLVLDDGRELSADAVVLATGRFIGGGIRHDGSGFRETVFGLPVFVDGKEPGDRWTGDLLSRNAAADQPALRAGVRVDAQMRPVDVTGRPVHPNLFAAGAVIAGFDPAKDRSGLGAVAVTALLAGRHAARPAQPETAASAPGGASI